MTKWQLTKKVDRIEDLLEVKVALRYPPVDALEEVSVVRKSPGLIVDLHLSGQVCGQVVENGLTVQCHKLPSTEAIHGVHIAGMRPEAVVDGGKSETCSVTAEGRQHHVTRVERVDKVGRKAVLLLHRIRHQLTSGGHL